MPFESTLPLAVLCLALAGFAGLAPQDATPELGGEPAAQDEAEPAQDEAQPAQDEAEPAQDEAETDAAGPERPDGRWIGLEGRPRAYLMVAPPGFDPTVPCPVLVALPSGDQTMRTTAVDSDLHWAAEAQARGWLLVCPRLDDLTPYGGAYPDAASVVAAILESLAKHAAVEGKRFFLAGIENGGRTAFQVAMDVPDRWHALLAAPGYPAAGTSEHAVAALAGLPVALLVGEDDEAWRLPMEAARARLEGLGSPVSLRTFPGEGSAPASLTGAVLFDELEALRALAAARAAELRGPEELLDGFHRAAAEASGERYFGSFALGAVFLGTDPDERWTVEQFRAYAAPYFSQGRGWTYVPLERHVALAPDGAVAWFDERLENAAYGEARGTGVLVRTEAGWKIAQYNLTLPVPNELALDLVERIRQAGSPRAEKPARETPPAKDPKGAKGAKPAPADGAPAEGTEGEPPKGPAKPKKPRKDREEPPARSDG